MRRSESSKVLEPMVQSAAVCRSGRQGSDQEDLEELDRSHQLGGMKRKEGRKEGGREEKVNHGIIIFRIVFL